MAQDESSDRSDFDLAQGNSNGSGNRARRHLMRVRRDASAELEESGSEYAGESESDPSDDDEEEEQDRTAQEETSQNADNSSQGGRSKRPKYATLQSHTKEVRSEAVTGKWRRSTAAAQVKVRTLLSLSERPVMNSYRNVEHRREAQASLAGLNRMFEERLPFILFPVTTKEWHFDYEAILRNNRDLEQQLAAAKHSSGLIQVEIQKETKLLAEAKEDLRELERNANAERKARAQREQGTPQLWAAPDGARSDDANHIGLQDLSQSASAAIKNEDTFNFMPELEHHLTIIEENLDQLKGLPEVVDSVSSLLTQRARQNS